MRQRQAAQFQFGQLDWLNQLIVDAGPKTLDLVLQRAEAVGAGALFEKWRDRQFGFSEIPPGNSCAGYPTPDRISLVSAYS